jgi:hypothetical protein
LFSLKMKTTTTTTTTIQNNFTLTLSLLSYTLLSPLWGTWVLVTQFPSSFISTVCRVSVKSSLMWCLCKEQ